MKFTPLDINKKEFRKSIRGYNTEEVESFLIDVSRFLEIILAERDKLIKENKAITKEKVDLERKPKKKSSYANEDANIIVREAKLSGLELLEKNRTERDQLQEEIIVLKQQKNSFLKQLKRLFASQLDLIEILETEDIELDEISEIQKQNDRKKISSRQIEQVPSLKKAIVKETFNLESHADDPKIDIDLNKFKSVDKSNLDLNSIKQKAKEILDNKEEVQGNNNNSQSHYIDLDKLLGKIGEEYS